MEEIEFHPNHSGRKRTRECSQSGTTDEGVEDCETPVKKRKVYEQWLHETSGYCGMTPKRSPIDSAYESVGKSPYLSHPSVGTSSGIGLTPLPWIESSLFQSLTKSEYEEESKEFQSHSDLVDLFRRKYRLFKAELDPRHNLADKLYQRGILSKRVMERLLEETSRRRRADIFIKETVHDDLASIPGIYEKVVSVFHEEKIEYLLKTKDNTNRAKSLKMDRLTERETFLMSELQFLAKGLEENLEPRDIIDELLICGSLSFVDHEDIYTTTGRAARVRILLEHVKRAGNQHFHTFIDALNPKLTKQLRDTHLLPTQEIKLKLHQRNSNTDHRPKTSTSTGISMMQLKLNFGPEPQQDVEMSVVDHNNSSLNVAFEEEAMDTAGISTDSAKFSSIKIKFAAHSKDALSRVLDTLENPSKIQKLLTSMMTYKHRQILMERNVKTVEVELLVPKDSILSCKCSCKLSKELIVQGYSLLEENIQDPTSLIEAFIESNLLEENMKQNFLELKEKDLPPASKTDPMLMKLLKLPPECVCFFEKHLLSMDKGDLIQKLTEKQESKCDSGGSVHIHAKDIRRNWSYLLEEVEPKMFLTIFAGTDEKLDEIISTDSREKRCKVFLRCMLKSGQKTIDKFCRELVQGGMKYIVDILCRKDTDYKRLCSNILKCYSLILEEVEPTKLRDKLVQEGIFKAKEFDEITKISLKRRDRVVWLLHKLLKKDEHALDAFYDCLKIAKYDKIVTAISDSGKDDVSECPYLMSKIEEKNGTKTFGEDLKVRYEFDISWKEEARSESELQLSLHKEIYKGNEENVDRTEFTKAWLVNQSAFKDRDGDHCHTNDLSRQRAETFTGEEDNNDTPAQEIELDESVIQNSSLKIALSSKIQFEEDSDGGSCCSVSSTSETVAYCSSHLEQPEETSDNCASSNDLYQMPTSLREETNYRSLSLLQSSAFAGHKTFLAVSQNTRQRILVSGSPVGSAGTACYSNDFEDISPCSSPASFNREEDIWLRPQTSKICSTQDMRYKISNFPSHPFSKNNSRNVHFMKESVETSSPPKEVQASSDRNKAKRNKCYNKWLGGVFEKVISENTSVL